MASRSQDPDKIVQDQMILSHMRIVDQQKNHVVVEIPLQGEFFYRFFLLNGHHTLQATQPDLYFALERELEAIEHVDEREGWGDRAFEGFYDVFSGSTTGQTWGAALLLHDRQHGMMVAVTKIYQKVAELPFVPPFPYVYYDYVGNTVSWAIIANRDQNEPLWDSFGVLREQISSPCTYLLSLANVYLRRLVGPALEFFSLINAGGIAGCLCYVRSAEIAGLLPFVHNQRGYTEVAPKELVVDVYRGHVSGERRFHPLTFPYCAAEEKAQGSRNYSIVWTTPHKLHQLEQVIRSLQAPSMNQLLVEFVRFWQDDRRQDREAFPAFDLLNELIDPSLSVKIAFTRSVVDRYFDGQLTEDMLDHLKIYRRLFLSSVFFLLMQPQLLGQVITTLQGMVPS